MHINHNIRKARELKGLSQAKIAKLLDEKRSTYAEWERTTVPRADILQKISAITGVPMDEILSENADISQGKIYASNGNTNNANSFEINLDTILRALSRIENGQSYIRAEIRSYGQYQIQEQVRYDHVKFLQAMDKVGKLYAANLKVGDGQDKQGPNA